METKLPWWRRALGAKAPQRLRIDRDSPVSAVLLPRGQHHVVRLTVRDAHEGRSYLIELPLVTWMGLRKHLNAYSGLVDLQQRHEDDAKRVDYFGGPVAADDVQ